MKNLKLLRLLIVLCLLVPSSRQLRAQWINSLSVSPPYPTSTDTITLTADCSFPYGPCDIKTQQQFVNGNNLYGSAMHCLGMLAFICSEMDVYKIPPLPAGTYVFNFQLDATQSMPPCIPGINPGPNSFLTFIVTNASSIAENSNMHLNVFAADNFIHIQTYDALWQNENMRVDIFNMAGVLLQTNNVTIDKDTLLPSPPTDGPLIVKISDNNGHYFARLLYCR